MARAISPPGVFFLPSRFSCFSAWSHTRAWDKKCSSAHFSHSSASPSPSWSPRWSPRLFTVLTKRKKNARGFLARAPQRRRTASSTAHLRPVASSALFLPASSSTTPDGRPWAGAWAHCLRPRACRCSFSWADGLVIRRQERTMTEKELDKHSPSLPFLPIVFPGSRF